MSSAMKSLAEAAAKAGLGADPAGGGDVDADHGEGEERTIDPEVEEAMVAMVPEYKSALKAGDDKALAHVLMAMFECCASMAPPMDIE